MQAGHGYCEVGRMVMAIDLGRSTLRRLLLALLGLNLIFTAGTGLFIHYFAWRDYYGPRGRAFIDYVLVQFHLGVENVVAAWYSSMLILLVSAACVAAYALDRRAPREGARGWLDYGWLILAVTFAGLSLDEIGSLHERIGMLVSLNRASLLPHATGAVGWVYMLAIPILAVALFMLAFGWLRIRRAPAAFVLLAIGVFLYLSDPFLELLEHALVARGSGAIVFERMLEEGVAELGGTTCFLFAVLLYCRRIAGNGVHLFPAPPRWMAGVVTAILLAGIPATRALVERLPPGDNGIPENWFPAAALFALALWTGASGRKRLALVLLGLSAFFGAGLYGYVPALAASRVLVTVLVTAIAALLPLLPNVGRRTRGQGNRASAPSPWPRHS